jgi:hypothetical protein
MDFEFFETLTRKDAEKYLQRFLETERATIPPTLDEARSAGVPVDYSVASISPLFSWIAPQVDHRQVTEAFDVPDWISSTSQQDFVELADASKPLILRAAFYLGEAFARNYVHLRWDIGHADFAHQQQPAVVGFRNSMELPVLLVTENLFLNALDSANMSNEFDRVINAWIKRV